MDRYLFDGQDQTLLYDTTYRGWQIDFTEDNRYSQSYSEFLFAADSVITSDTLGYDSVNMQYVVDYDTLRYVDTTIIPHLTTGQWELLNSEEDLQLRNDSVTNQVDIYRILDLDKNNLKLRKGNEEFYLSK